MRRHEVDSLIRSLDKSYAFDLSKRCQTIIALYHDNYDQRRTIYLEDDSETLSADALNAYGIYTPSSKASSFSGRKYVLFIDSPDVFSSEETFKDYYIDYCLDYLPVGVSPDEFAMKFAVDSFEEYDRMLQMILKMNSSIYPLFSMTRLITNHGMELMYQDVQRIFSEEYNIFSYDAAIHEKLMDFFKRSQVREENYKSELLAHAEDLANTLNSSEKKAMIYAIYKPTDPNELGKVTLMLAYLNFKYGFPIHCDPVLQNAVMQRLRSFYFPDEVGTLYDTLSILRNYQQVGVLRKEFCEYMVYMPDEGRQLTASITYLENGELTSVSADMLKLDITDSYDDKEFGEGLLALEASMKYETFLHVGNTLSVMIPGVGQTVVYVRDLEVNFPGIMIPSESTFTPFRGKIDLEIIRQMLPIKGFYFHALGEEKDALSLFKERLSALHQKGQIKITGSIRATPYIPEVFKDGEALVHYHLYLFLNDKRQFRGGSERLVNLCSYQNVAFRNHLVQELIPLVSLKHLRREDYLTVYGTNFTQLRVTEDFFKTRL